MDNTLEVGVRTANNNKGKHFYFSDRKGKVYCLAVTRLGGLLDTHTVGGDGQVPAYIQILGYKESNMPAC